MKSKNGILFLDELDKIQATQKGQEVSSTLLHILDYTQNHEFKDEYLSGIPIDLSQLIIIIAINDISKIDKILLDRLQLIPFTDYNNTDKFTIGYKYLAPRIMKNLKMNLNEVIISEQAVRYIISKSQIPEKGVRQLERNIGTILERINTLKQIHLGNRDMCGIKLSYMIPNFRLPIELNKQNIDILFSEFGGKRSVPPHGMYM